MDLDTSYIPIWEAATRVLLAIFLGGMIGLERESRRKPAGLRTHIMVSLGAAIFTLVTLELFRSAIALGSVTRPDPLRIVEGVIGGLGFLGAGSIIRSGGSVEGVTTAAGIWVVGAIGLCCGCGYYSMAFLGTAAALLTLLLLGYVERHLLATKVDSDRR